MDQVRKEKENLRVSLVLLVCSYNTNKGNNLVFVVGLDRSCNKIDMSCVEFGNK